MNSSYILFIKILFRKILFYLENHILVVFELDHHMPRFPVYIPGLNRRMYLGLNLCEEDKLEVLDIQYKLYLP